MLSLLRTLFGQLEAGEPGPEEALVKLATEKAIDATDTRLRVVSGYKKKLRVPVERAIAYARGLASGFVEPLWISRSAFASDAQVHAFFGSASDIAPMINSSRPVRDFLRTPDHRSLDVVYAAMRMARSEKLTVAPALSGDQVQMDVMRTAVNFSHKQIVLPSNSIDALHRELAERAFMSLTEIALRRLTSIKQKKTDLDKQRALLKDKLKHLQKRQLGLQPLVSADATLDSVEEVEQRLEETERAFQATSASLSTLDNYLEQVAAVLAEPEAHIRIKPTSSRVTPMGFKAINDREDGTNEVFYTEIELADSTSFVGRFVTFPWREMFPEGQRFR